MSASIKIAYGLLNIQTRIEYNATLKELIGSLRGLVTERFNVESDARIQIVRSLGKPNAELEEEIPELDVRVADYFNDDNFLFYARIIRKFENIDYIKTDLDNRGIQRACYMKMDDVIELRNGRTLDQIECFVESDFEPQPEPNQPEPIRETECCICIENQVSNVSLFRCSHLFCDVCNARWSQNAVTFNCPLCRC